VPNGAEEVEHDKKEHDEIVKLMKRIEDVDPYDRTFMELVRQLEAQLSHR
jgi:hypothetical protein